MTKPKIEAAIDEALGIADQLKNTDTDNQPDDYIPPSEVELVLIEPDVEEGDLDPEADIKMAAAYLKDMMKRGYTMTDQAMKLAMSTQHPRVFEIIAELMKQTTNVTKELVDIHKKSNKELAPPKSPNQGGGDTNIEKAIVFTGTASDLQQLLNDAKDTEKVEVGNVIEHDE